LTFFYQLEAKEAAWRAEWSARLVDERTELERQLAEERAARSEAAETAVSSLAEERRTWQQQMDVLLEKTRYLLAEKERLDKNIRQEVDTQVQVLKKKKNKKPLGCVIVTYRVDVFTFDHFGSISRRPLVDVR
jgi:hypothetical protein